MGVPQTVDFPPEDTLDQVLRRLADMTHGNHHEENGAATVEDSVRRIETRMEDAAPKRK